MNHWFRRGYSRLSLAASLIVSAGCTTQAPPPSTAPSTVPAAARQETLAPPTASPAATARSDATAEPLPSPVPLGLAAIPDAAFVHWQDGDITSGRLVLRDSAGRALATWRAPEGLDGPDPETGWSVGRPTLAEAVSPDGRWLALVEGESMPGDLTALPESPLRLRVVDLADGSLRAEQVLLGPEALAGLRRDTLAEIESRHPGESRPPLAWELPTGLPGTTPAPRTTSGDEWKGRWVAEEVVEGFNEGLGQLAWSPDSRRLAVIAAPDAAGSDVYLLEVDGWRWWLPAADPGQPGRAVWHPDGSRLLVLGAGPMSRASGFPDVAGAWLIDPDQEAVADSWPYGAGGPIDEMLLGWIRGGQAIVTEMDHGCGICAIWLLGPGGRKVDPLAEGPPPESRKLTPSLNSLAAMPRGDWVGLAGEIPDLPEDLAADLATAPAPMPPASARGSFLLNVVEPRLERLSDAPDASLLYWGGEGYPFMLASGEVGGEAMAVGPGGKRRPLGVVPDAKPRVAVTADDRWRVLYGSKGLWIFDTQSQQRAAWTGGPVTDVRWSPGADRLLWIAGQALWLMTLPDGEARRIASWHGTASPGYPDDGFRDGLAWLVRRVP